jgi:HEAT repeat protein
VRDPRAIDMLVTLANGNGEQSLRERALFALSQQRAGEAGAALRAFAEDDSKPKELRERAIFLIGQRNAADQSEYLRGLYRKLRDPDLREKVLFSISQHRGAGTDGFLTGIASDRDEPMELRKKAIFWLGQSRVDMARLTGMYAQLDVRELKEQVIFALSQRRDSGAVDALMEIARSDSDRELRKKAIFWLGQSRDPRAATFLAELIAK